MAKANPNIPPRIVSVLNMKGGVGKTTIAGNVFRELFLHFKKSVLLVDFDPQYNLSQLLLSRTKHDKLVQESRTLWHVMEPGKTTSILKTATKDYLLIDSTKPYIHALRYLKVAPEIKLDLLAGNFALAKLNLKDDRTLDIAKKRFSSFLGEAKAEYDLIVLDCNPSSSFMTRVAIEMSTHILIPVKPDKYSLLGIEMLSDFISEFPNLLKAPEIMILLNGLPLRNPSNTFWTELRGHKTFGPCTLVSYIPHAAILAAKSEHSGFAVERGGPYSDIVRQRLVSVASEIAGKMGIKK